MRWKDSQRPHRMQRVSFCTKYTEKMYNNCGKADVVGSSSPHSPSPLLLVYLARFPFHAHENLQRPRVKVELTKPVLVRQQQQQQRGRGRCRGNNNVETKESIYSTWGTVKISCFMCALDVNSSSSSGSGSSSSFSPSPVPYCVSVSSCLHLQPERRQCCRSFSLPRLSDCPSHRVQSRSLWPGCGVTVSSGSQP